jgi:HSP20 family protein
LHSQQFGGQVRRLQRAAIFKTIAQGKQGECCMAEKPTAITPTRSEHRLGRSRPFGGGSPFNALQRFADEVDRMFDDFGFGRRWAGPSLWREAGAEMWAPDIDVFQKNNELTIRADLPGLTKDDISVDITDDAISIQGERKRESQEEREGVYRSERSYGSFCRVIPLPEGAITEQAKATFRDGVLEITMPAPPGAKGRRLEIAGEARK